MKKCACAIFYAFSKSVRHFDILLLQTLQDLLKTALKAGAGNCFEGSGRDISCLTTIAWLAKSPDLSFLDFWF